MDLTDNAALKGANPSNYGYIYSAERDAPPPEVGWSDKAKSDQQSVNLYSENVVTEGNTTESVDRESIANLSSTRQQWESIFTSHNTSQSAAPTAKKKGTPKWEVRLPYKEKNVVTSPEKDSDPPQTLTSDYITPFQTTEVSAKSPEMESAIEREIRLAHEREEMLRREKEEQQRLAEKQQRSSQGQSIIASYEAVSAESESYQPAYNELTEADRGPDLWGVETREERTDTYHDESDSGSQDENPNESIIEREIRLQNEREAELRKQRLSGVAIHREDTSQTKQQVIPTQQEEYTETQQVTERYEEVQPQVEQEEADDMNASQSGESLIARELRELKEREEEMKRMRSARQPQAFHDETDSSPAVANIQYSSPSGSFRGEENSQQTGLFPPPAGKRNSVSSNSSDSYSAKPFVENSPSVHDLKICNDDDDDDDKPDMYAKVETPIEREIRLARERENDLRRAKGLPELAVNDEDYYGSYSSKQEDAASDNAGIRPRHQGQPKNTMRKFASNRLQQEVAQQKERERALRTSGTIASTEEQQEHIQPKRYMEITGTEKADSSALRNFVPNKRNSIPSTPPREPVKETSPSTQTDGSTPSSGKKGGAVGSGGRLFSYKEFKQTAESKIERELREMREREEELRMQRNVETPR